MSATFNNNLPTLANEGGLSAYLEQIKQVNELTRASLVTDLDI